MRITTIMKGGLLACILLSLHVDIVAQGGGSLKPPAGITRRVRFARGRTTAILKGAVVRGTEDRYILGARAGQTMIVHLTSREKNAEFLIQDPNGTAVEGLDDGLADTDWTGELPVSGDYSIWVSPTRGNATYTLEITIR